MVGIFRDEDEEKTQDFPEKSHFHGEKKMKPNMQSERK